MRHRVILILLLGVSLVVGSIGFGVQAAKRRQPGVLVAVEDSLVWEGPAEAGQDPPKMAEATFRLRNTGGRPVHILEIISGCGCATPKVSTTTVAAGGETTVDVKALTFPVGEKVIRFAVETDSAVTKSVPLFLRVIGNRRPPFLMNVTGDLSYLGDGLSTNLRTVEVMTIEKKGDPHQVPKASCNLPFFEVETLDVVEKPYVTAGTVQCSYRYRVRQNGEAPTDTFVGEFRAIDPWDDRQSARLPIQGEVRHAMRANPTAVTLAADDPTASILVTTREACPGLTVSAAGAPILIEQDETHTSDRFHVYRLRLKPSEGRIAAGIHSLILRPMADSPERAVVRVTIKEGR